jgi:hypothetical protein
MRCKAFFQSDYLTIKDEARGSFNKKLVYTLGIPNEEARQLPYERACGFAIGTGYILHSIKTYVVSNSNAREPRVFYV